ncbi:hypothetical protein JTE90_004770, partial [Oedothorax gibbosus]
APPRPIDAKKLAPFWAGTSPEKNDAVPQKTPKAKQGSGGSGGRYTGGQIQKAIQREKGYPMARRCIGIPVVLRMSGPVFSPYGYSGHHNFLWGQGSGTEVGGGTVGGHDPFQIIKEVSGR